MKIIILSNWCHRHQPKRTISIFVSLLVLLSGFRENADAFLLTSEGTYSTAKGRFGERTTLASTISSHRHRTWMRFNDQDDGEEEEDPIFNDSLIYYTPGQMDYARKPHANGLDVDDNINILRERLHVMLVRETVENQLKRPPRKELKPVEFIREILAALKEPDDPLPDSGLSCLFLSSSRRWRGLLRESVGAPKEADSGTVARALGNAISRERNQFGILVGADDAEEYVASFPGDIVDYNDGFCFVECQLRDVRTNSLLVKLGWQLKRRKSDQAWLVDRIDWQDFRNQFRPGIGREEWLVTP